MISDTLLLIPTEFEKSMLEPAVASQFPHTRICGFGLVQSAITTSRIISELKEEIEQVILLGIAGTYDEDELPVGSASQFAEAACHGIGAGEAENFRSAVELGWQDISDAVISLASPSHTNHRLLSVCSASGSLRAAKCRRDSYGAVAEDMEAYSVAAACSWAGLPCSVIRGISNLAGDRDKSNWDVQSAMQSAVRQLVVQTS